MSSEKRDFSTLRSGAAVRTQLGENATTIMVHGFVVEVQGSRIGVRITALRPWRGGECTRVHDDGVVFEVGSITWDEATRWSLSSCDELP